jgi:hypothetical protein
MGDAMNAMGLTILVLAVMGFGWLVWTLVAKEREKARVREQFVMERGWTYTKAGKHDRAFAIQGSEGGMPWILESYQGSKNKSGRTVWKASGPPFTGGAAFIGSKAMAAILRNPIGNRLARWGLQLVAGEDDGAQAWNRLMEGYQEVETGDPDFSAMYAVLATDAGQASKLTNGDCRRAMLDWERAHKVGRVSQGRLGVTWSEAGLSVRWSGSAIQDPEDISAFLAMALTLRSSVQSGW